MDNVDINIARSAVRFACDEVVEWNHTGLVNQTHQYAVRLRNEQIGLLTVVNKYDVPDLQTAKLSPRHIARSGPSIPLVVPEALAKDPLDRTCRPLLETVVRWAASEENRKRNSEKPGIVDQLMDLSLSMLVHGISDESLLELEAMLCIDLPHPGGFIWTTTLAVLAEQYNFLDTIYRG